MKKSNLFVEEKDRIEATDNFIKKNNFKLVKTDQEILDYIDGGKDMFDFRSGVLIDYISFENAKVSLIQKYVKEVEEGKKKWVQITDIKEAVQDL